MRISTSMIYAKGLASIQQQTAQLLHTQQQVSSGRRVLTPADDPIAAARALEVGQSKGVNAQFIQNLGYADDNLKLLENKLVGVGDILQYTRQRAVQAGNGAHSAEDLRYIATDLKSQFDALLALANTRNGQGEYLFSGYRADVQPFNGGLSGVTYAGDQGGRTIQVSASRFMPVSLPGTDVFERTRTIDVGAVRQPTAENPTTNDALYSFKGSSNAGSADALTVSFDNSAVPPLPPDDPDSPRNPENQGRRYVVTYTEADVVPRDPSTGSYAIEEVVPGVGRSTVASGLVPGTSHAFNGISVQLPAYVAPDPMVPDDKGSLVPGDSFEIFVASTNMFENYALAVSAFEDHTGVGPAGGVAFALHNLDFAIENVLKVRAQVGSQMVEVEQLTNVGSDLDLQYSQTLSRLQDVDYAEALSRLIRQQTFLEAAQQSYMRVTNLSLFNFLS